MANFFFDKMFRETNDQLEPARRSVAQQPLREADDQQEPVRTSVSQQPLHETNNEYQYDTFIISEGYSASLAPSAKPPLGNLGPAEAPSAFSWPADAAAMCGPRVAAPRAAVKPWQDVAPSATCLSGGDGDSRESDLRSEWPPASRRGSRPKMKMRNGPPAQNEKPQICDAQWHGVPMTHDTPLRPKRRQRGVN